MISFHALPTTKRRALSARSTHTSTHTHTPKVRDGTRLQALLKLNHTAFSQEDRWVIPKRSQFPSVFCPLRAWSPVGLRKTSHSGACALRPSGSLRRSESLEAARSQGARLSSPGLHNSLVRWKRSFGIRWDSRTPWSDSMLGAQKSSRRARWSS